jgi:hypothetical protein
MKLSRKLSVSIGILFLSAFLFYGIGQTLVEDVLSKNNAINLIDGSDPVFALGALLMFGNSIVVIAIGILISKFIKPYSEQVALGYLSTRVAEGLILAVGIVAYASVGALSHAGIVEPVTLARDMNQFFYILGMLSLGIGSVITFSFIAKTDLIPRWLSIWAVISYSVFSIGMIAEFFGLQISLIAAGIGGIFEIGFPVYLFIKGMRLKVE